jgi:hypothetical protein
MMIIWFIMSFSTLGVLSKEQQAPKAPAQSGAFQFLHHDKPQFPDVFYFKFHSATWFALP